MYLKIYFNEKPVYLCDELDSELKEMLHHPDTIFMDEFSAPAIKSLLHEIDKPEFHAGVLLHTDLQELKKAFFKYFTEIETAGGIVQNENQQLLFIYRLDKWDLPKGKVEEGEDLQNCAIREVEEETGVTNLTIQYKIGETYHTYNAFGKHFIKTTYWFHITCSSIQKLIPQTEENISDLKWVAKNEITELMKNTYPSIKDILHTFFQKDLQS